MRGAIAENTSSGWRRPCVTPGGDEGIRGGYPTSLFCTAYRIMSALLLIFIFSRMWER
jgi:hypothetical protein